MTHVFALNDDVRGATLGHRILSEVSLRYASNVEIQTLSYPGSHGLSTKITAFSNMEAISRAHGLFRNGDNIGNIWYLCHGTLLVDANGHDFYHWKAKWSMGYCCICGVERCN